CWLPDRPAELGGTHYFVTLVWITTSSDAWLAPLFGRKCETKCGYLAGTLRPWVTARREDHEDTRRARHDGGTGCDRCIRARRFRSWKRAAAGFRDFRSFRRKAPSQGA